MSTSVTNPHEAEQILYLKRLLVTLKQQFEKNLHELSEELHGEQSRNKSLQKELDHSRCQLEELRVHYDDELKSLREQQIILREMLKKSQEEQKTAHQSRPVILDDSPLENDILMQELHSKQKKIIELETKLEQQLNQAKNEIDQLKLSLSFFEEQEDKQELITSNTSTYQLRQELELIKQTIAQGAQESKVLENRYADLFHEKVNLEQQIIQLHTQLEHQSTNLAAFKEQIEELNLQRQSLEITIQEQNAHRLKDLHQQQTLEMHIQKLEDKYNQQALVQEKYEQLKEEFIQLTNHFEEVIELRLRAEKQLEQWECLVKDQEQALDEKCRETENLTQEKEQLQTDIQHMHELLGDTEARLKVAQQHLAKKVKESALLAEKVEEQQNSIDDYLQIVETAKSQISQLQASLELYQSQEKRLQDQLHEALKGTESQVAKWEKKYFEMYDKWQESENQIRELRKFEEKHLQMQNLLANLGNFMGSSSSMSPSQIYQAMSASSALDIKPAPESSELPPNHNEVFEEKYDLFGMPHLQDKSKQNTYQ